MFGTPVRDHGGAIGQEEQEEEADGDNGTGKKCMKLEMGRVDKDRGTRKSDNNATGTRFLLGQVGR